MGVEINDKKERGSSNTGKSITMSEFNKKNEKRGNKSSFEHRLQEELKSSPELDLDVYN